MWLSNPGNVVSVSAELSSTFYLIFTNLSLNNHMWPVAPVLDREDLDHTQHLLGAVKGKIC